MIREGIKLDNNIYSSKKVENTLFNDEIEKLRLSTTSALLSGRKDVLVVSSVSCIYGIGNPDDFHENTILIKKGLTITRNLFLRKLVNKELKYFKNQRNRMHYARYQKLGLPIGSGVVEAAGVHGRQCDVGVTGDGPQQGLLIR